MPRVTVETRLPLLYGLTLLLLGRGGSGGYPPIPLG